MRPMMRLIVWTFAGVLLAGVTACSAPPGARSPGLLGGLFGDEAIIAADHMRYGFPDTEMLRYRRGYVLSYDASRRVPRWVAERLDPSSTAPDRPREDKQYRVDESLPSALRVTTADFHESGYVRGRLAAAANHRGDADAFRQTYLLSNVAPQRGPDFRSTVWVGLDQRVRAWARESDNLLVITGTLFLPKEGENEVRYELIGERRIGVPTHFFKVLLRERGRSSAMLAFLVPHRPTESDVDYAGFLISVDALEVLSGLDFFPKLGEPTQSQLEAAEITTLWPFPGGKKSG